MTHCRAGHALTAENTYVGFARGKERKVCRTCRRLHQTGYRKSIKPEEPQLTPAAMARLRSAWSEGVSPRDLAERFGLHRGQIQAAVAGMERT